MGTVKEKERTVCPAGVILTVLITTVNAHNYGYATFGIYCFTNLSQPLNLISNHFWAFTRNAATTKQIEMSLLHGPVLPKHHRITQLPNLPFYLK